MYSTKVNNAEVTASGLNGGNLKEFLQGAKFTIPLIIGAIPFGIIFGTLAQQQGLSIWFTQAMSLFVFAGASQFIALGLIAAGAAPWLIIFTTFIVNLRHMLYAASLIPFVANTSQRMRALISFGLTDESFVVAIKRYQGEGSDSQKHAFYFGSMFAMYSNWQLCTFLGFYLGGAIPQIGEWGLEVAMPITFIGMVVPYLVKRSMWAAVVIAGTLSVLTINWPHKLGLIVSVLVAVGMATYLSQYDKVNEDNGSEDSGTEDKTHENNRLISEEETEQESRIKTQKESKTVGAAS